MAAEVLVEMDRKPSILYAQKTIFVQEIFHASIKRDFPICGRENSKKSEELNILSTPCLSELLSKNIEI